MLDTETSSIIPSNEVNARHMRVYDLGLIVANREGEIFERVSMCDVTRLLARDTYTNTPTRQIESAYYAEKMPLYYEGLRMGAWTPANFFDMWQTVNDTIKKYHVRDVWAYNAKFDRDALNATLCEESNGFRRFFMPYGIKWRDIWSTSSECITNTAKYVKWCMRHGYVSEKGNPQTSAEIVYRYLTGNHNFVEAHTALQDCEIELVILQKCFKAKRKKPKSLGNGWRNAANIAKELNAK